MPFSWIATLLLVSVVNVCAFKDVKQWEDRTLTKSRESSVNILGFIKLFDAAFYVENNYQPKDFPGNFSYALSLRYEKNLKKETLIKTADEILKDLYSADDLQKFVQELRLINDHYLDVNK